jgi:hypothetical protein
MENVKFTEPILDPSGQSGAEADTTLAPRFGTLTGARVGLLDNTKANANVLLSVLGEMLSDAGARAGAPAELVRLQKRGFTQPVSAGEIDQIRKRCDLVVTAIGD